MNTTNLDKIVAHKAGLDVDGNVEDAAIIAIARAETLADISQRYPYSFLERKSTSITLAAGDVEKALPEDFVRKLSLAIYASDNVVHPVYTEKPSTHDEAEPDEDETDRPFTNWIEWNSTTGKPWIRFGQKSDGVYTVRLRYQKKLAADQVAILPNGLAAIYGMMILLCKPDETAAYANLYEAAIAKMWASDMPDLNDAPDFKADRAIERFNQDMHNL